MAASRYLMGSSLAIICLPFLPASNLFFYVGFVAAERHGKIALDSIKLNHRSFDSHCNLFLFSLPRILYLPSAGYCILVSISLEKAVFTPRKMIWCLEAICSTRKDSTMKSLQKSNSENKVYNDNNNTTRNIIFNNKSLFCDKNKKNERRKVFCSILFLFTLSALAAKTVVRNRDWQDELSLYSSGLKINPPKGKTRRPG